MKKPDRIISYMALLALVAVVLAPPEAHGSGRMILVITATFAWFALTLNGSIPSRYVGAGLAGYAVLLAHALLLSADAYRSLEFLPLAWAYYSLFGVFRYSPQDLRHRASVTLVLLAFTVSAYGVYQYLWGFDNLADFVQASQASEAARASILSTLATERVFSTFALPGTLWGFLILTLPLHAGLWSSANRWLRVAIAVNVGLVILVSALTQSYGFVLGLLVVLGGWALTRTGARSLGRTALTSMLVVPPVAGVLALLYAARMGGHNPVSLRLQNWMSAWEIFASHPLGSGLNTYGILYLQHQQPGANETQFAHNTPLQILAELGVFGLVPMIVIAVHLFYKRTELNSLTGIQRWLLLALSVWAVHNLMDINVYFGSVGAVGAALAGMCMWAPYGTDGPAQGASRWLHRFAGTFAVLTVLASGVMYVSGELLYRARGELEFQRTSEAAATLKSAARINPFDSSIMHEAGQIELELYHFTQNASHLEASRAYFSRAVRLSPSKVGPRIGLALALSSEDRVQAAIQELEIAQALNPAGRQAGNIRRLIERRMPDGDGL